KEGFVVVTLDGTVPITAHVVPEVVDTTGAGDLYASGTAWAVIGTVLSGVTTTDPFLPHVTAATSQSPRTARTASSNDGASYSDASSSALQNSRSTSFTTKSRKSSRWRSTQNESDSVSDTLPPAAWAATTALRYASLAPSRSNR